MILNRGHHVDLQTFEINTTDWLCCGVDYVNSTVKTRLNDVILISTVKFLTLWVEHKNQALPSLDGFRVMSSLTQIRIVSRRTLKFFKWAEIQQRLKKLVATRRNVTFEEGGLPFIEKYFDLPILSLAFLWTWVFLNLNSGRNYGEKKRTPGNLS